MKLSVATNFRDDLIEAVKNYPVYELYGKLDRDFVGGGRSSYLLTPIHKDRVRDHVALAKKYGIRFNYLLNAACMDNLETTKEGQKQIRKLLDWMTKIGVSATTVSNPFLLNLIKKSYPHLNVRVSVFACVDHLRKAKFWEDHGADVICLDSHTVNRDFKELQYLRENLSCELELLTNNHCMSSCYMAQTHPTVMAHSSQTKHRSGGFVIDHCLLFCLREKMKNPVNLLRADWIRPEDIIHYENVGIEHFKLVERNLPTAEMVKRVKAYSERRYEGNLLDLIQGFGFKEKKEEPWDFWRKLKYLIRPGKINIFKLGKLKELCEFRGMMAPLKQMVPPVFIDNQKLDGFITRFMQQSCRHVDCEACQYCHRFADRAITIDAAYQEKSVQLHDEVNETIVSGNFWN